MVTVPAGIRGTTAVVQGRVGANSDARFPWPFFEPFAPPRREGLHAKCRLGTLEVVPIKVGQVNGLLPAFPNFVAASASVARPTPNVLPIFRAYPQGFPDGA